MKLKNCFIVLATFVVISAQATPELTIRYCKHQKNPAFESRARYDFRIIETNILSRGSDDSRRTVTIENLRIVGSNSSTINSFNAVATYNDVNYEIKATKQDFSFSMFLDEDEPAVVISHDSSGAEVENIYNCKVENFPSF